MKKVGIIICGRYQSCRGGKCLRALRERAGAFSIYPKDEDVQLVGYSYCGSCPGGNVGKIDNPDGYGKVKGICGDTMEIFLKIGKNNIEKLNINSKDYPPLWRKYERM